MDIKRLKDAVTDNNVPWVGVAIRRNPQQTSRHTGIIYRADDGNSGCLFLAHMAWHELFLNEPYDASEGYYCVVPEFPDPVLEESFADYCSHVASGLEKRRPPYTLLAADPTAFDTGGNWLSRDPDGGFNCSSFVVAVFHSYKVDLVNINTWPTGSTEDIQEQTALVCKMMNSHRANDRAQALKIVLQVGRHPRVRPEETAGACLEDANTRPIDYPQGKANGELVLREWDAHH